MKIVATTFLLVFLLVSCNDAADDTNELTFNDFQTSLQVDMNYNDIVATFGEPEKDLGSGIHIYVYVLEDATEVWIGYADEIVYANHVDEDQNILHTLIE